MGGEGLKKRKKVEKPGGQLDCQDTAFHACLGLLSSAAAA